MLVRVRVHLADGRQALLSAEVEEPPGTPEELLELLNREGQIRLGDRQSVPVEDVLRVEFAPPEPQTGPSWLGDLQDEDVASAMESRFEKPAYEEPS